jgi:hypothetical protein
VRCLHRLFAASVALLCAGCLHQESDDGVSFRFDFGSTLAGTHASPPGAKNGYLYATPRAGAGFEIPFKQTGGSNGDVIRPPVIRFCRPEGADACSHVVILHADSTASLHLAGEDAIDSWGRSCIVRDVRLQAEGRVFASGPVSMTLEPRVVYAKRPQAYLLGDTTLVLPQRDSLTVLRFMVDSAAVMVKGRLVDFNLVPFTGSAKIVCRPAGR